jgi:hypothetical protein
MIAVCTTIFLDRSEIMDYAFSQDSPFMHQVLMGVGSALPGCLVQAASMMPAECIGYS